MSRRLGGIARRRRLPVGAGCEGSTGGGDSIGVRKIVNANPGGEQAAHTWWGQSAPRLFAET